MYVRYYFYRWNGYDTDEHQRVVEEYTKVELAKRQLNAEKLQKELVSGQLSEETVKKVILGFFMEKIEIFISATLSTCICKI